MNHTQEPWILCPRGNSKTHNLPDRFWERDIRCNGEMVATTHGATEEEAEAIAREIVSLKEQRDALLIACLSIIAPATTSRAAKDFACQAVVKCLGGKSSKISEDDMVWAMAEIAKYKAIALCENPIDRQP